MTTQEILIDTVKNPPFKGRFLSVGFKCEHCLTQILSNAAESGRGWGSSGWMCATVACPSCGHEYLFTDSRLFCLSCEKDRGTCGDLTQVFVRDDIQGHIE